MFGQGPAQSQGSADMFGQPAAGPNAGFGGSPFGGAPQGFPPPGAGFGQPAAAAGAFGGFGPAPGAGGFGPPPQAAGGNLFAQPNPSGPPPGRRIVRAKRRAG